MITGFLLGLMGSLHCAAMCGPLVLMTPVVGSSRKSFVASRLVYHAGRILVYGLIGILFGLIGESIVFAGLQRWLAVITGVAMISAFFVATTLKAKLTRIPIAIKARFASLLRRRSYNSIFALGATNGLLPCGLVYMAAMASVAAGGLLGSMVSMIFFGLGTLPMLMAISILGKRLSLSRVPALQKLAPVAVVLVGVLLIIRSEPVGLFTIGPAKVRCPACLN